MDTPPFAVHRYGWEDPWEFADAATTAERLRAAGFLEVDTWTNEAPTVLADATAYAEFAATVVLRVHLAHLPDERLRARLLDEMTRLAADDDPPFCLDYRRLNLSALRP